MAPWLRGLRERKISQFVFEIEITGYGPAEVGSYKRLRERAKSPEGILAHRGLLVEAHHILEGEHLEYARIPFTYDDAPAVLIPSGLHRRIMNPRFTAEMNAFGGRRGGKARVDRRELLALYRAIYTWHTPFKELFQIVENIL